MSSMSRATRSSDMQRRRSRCGATPMKTLPSSLDPDGLLTETQAADLLQLSVRTLQSWRLRRVGPAYVQAGRAVRYRRRDLLSWIELNTVTRSVESDAIPP